MSDGKPAAPTNKSSDHRKRRLRRPRPTGAFARWGLVLYVLPFALAAVLVKLGLDFVGWDTVDVSPLLTGILAGNIFLLGFLLAGTLADFKESERLPSDLAASLESISDECEILYSDKSAPEAKAAFERVRSITTGINRWLSCNGSVDDVLADLNRLNRDFLSFEPLTQPNFIVRLKQEQAAVRRMVLRIRVIRDTSFVGAGYAVAELTSALLILGLLFFRIPPLGAELFLVGLIVFLLTYVIVLIKDLDNPFECSSGTYGSAEVSLTPLTELNRRLQGTWTTAMDGEVSASADSAVPGP